MIGALVATAMALGAANAPKRPSLAVVVTGHEGLSLVEASTYASRLSAALVAAGAAVPLDPQAILIKLGPKSPEACGHASRCLADIAQALGVAGLVTLEVGRVLEEVALVAGLLDARDGRKLGEQSNAVSAAEVDATFTSFAAELFKLAAPLPAPTDAPHATRALPPRPDLEPPQKLGAAKVPAPPPPASGLNFGPATVSMSIAAVVAGAVGGFAWGNAQYRENHLEAHYSPCSFQLGGRLTYCANDLNAAQVLAAKADIDARLWVAKGAGALAALLAAGALYILFQPPDAPATVQPAAW